ncbi:putative formimidoylglutamate deiminase [Dictyocaulus viviparus]|uniref:Putative formimidoylglutamate deiminase n=1 Tax=Dictyocaulus viviparus TaxID=29172 RepID=A0A0D8XPS9_DICVI|nr:putative formimidoylglutamate deiminase [Dictyocaulus viviparus]
MSFLGKTILPRMVWYDGKVHENLPITISCDGVITEIGGTIPYDVTRLPDEYCITTFREMLAAGITCVGEFHYVHHGSDRFDLDEMVLQAAEEAGIRITLIQTFYEAAGFDRPALHPVQKRFVSSYEEFVENLKKLMKDERKMSSIAVAGMFILTHSVRAVSFENIRKLYEFAMQKNLAFHIHLEEQPKEIEDCIRFFGQKTTPSDWLLQNLNINKRFSAVHATYTSRENVKKMVQNGANFVICPCTEGYLGDGIPHLVDNQSISFGTDCNNRIGFLEEMRWACYSQQMRHNSRCVAGLSANRLLHCATAGGARSLALDNIVGSFEIGKQMDFVSFNLCSPLLNGLSSDTIIDGIVFSCDNREIKRVVVSGITRFLQ